tara:strand:+ start:1734 stop:1868 length:135 start_codon:yes stop_codon:yes gene_type:complete
MKADGKVIDEIRAAKLHFAYAKKWEVSGPAWTEHYIGFVFESIS